MDMNPTRGGQRLNDAQSSSALSHPIPASGGSETIAGHHCSDAHVRPAGGHPKLVDHCTNETQCEDVDEPTISRDHNPIDAQRCDVAADPIDAGHEVSEAPTGCACVDPIDDREVIALIVSLWRQRVDLRRAEQRLDLQCQALCRRACDGDKKRAASVWSAIKKGKDCGIDGLEMALIPYRLAMEPLDKAAHAVELTLKSRSRKTQLWVKWGANVRGVGELTIAGLYGEAGRPLIDYRSVSALWKRFGLAVINGQRQRKVVNAEDAIEHGYSPQRRAWGYVVSTNLIKAQAEGQPYRALYDRRKAYELERGISKVHAHNRAMRIMVKELLKRAWIASRPPAAPVPHLFDREVVLANLGHEESGDGQVGLRGSGVLHGGGDDHAP